MCSGSLRDEANERILVYEYMHRRSLDAYIFGTQYSTDQNSCDKTAVLKNNCCLNIPRVFKLTGTPRERALNWRRRLQIIQGIADGVKHLHEGEGSAGSEAGQCAAGWRMAGQGSGLRDSKIIRRWSHRNSDKDRHTVSNTYSCRCCRRSARSFFSTAIRFQKKHHLFFLLETHSVPEFMVPSGYMAPDSRVRSERWWRDDFEVRCPHLRGHFVGDTERTEEEL